MSQITEDCLVLLGRVHYHLYVESILFLDAQFGIVLFTVNFQFWYMNWY